MPHCFGASPCPSISKPFPKPLCRATCSKRPLHPHAQPAGLRIGLGDGARFAQPRQSSGHRPVRVHRQLILAALKRKLFPAQTDVVHAVTELLVDRGERAAIVNGEMGCGKTTVGIATAAVLNAEGYRRPGALATPPGLSGGAKSRRRWPVPRSGCSMARTRWSSC